MLVTDGYADDNFYGELGFTFDKDIYGNEKKRTNESERSHHLHRAKSLSHGSIYLQDLERMENARAAEVEKMRKDLGDLEKWKMKDDTAVQILQGNNSAEGGHDLSSVTIEDFRKVNLPELKAFVLARCERVYERTKVNRANKGTVSDASNGSGAVNLLTMAFEVRAMNSVIDERISAKKREIDALTSGVAAAAALISNGGDQNEFNVVEREVRMTD